MAKLLMANGAFVNAKCKVDCSHSFRMYYRICIVILKTGMPLSDFHSHVLHVDVVSVLASIPIVHRQFAHIYRIVCVWGGDPRAIPG